MTTKLKLHPTTYAKRKYNFELSVPFDVAMDYSVALMAIAGSDGRLEPRELQWLLEEQAIMVADPDEYIAALREADWESADLDALLQAIRERFDLNIRRGLIYQAIRMCRADGRYSEEEQTCVESAAEQLGIEASVLASIESLAELEDSCDRLRFALLKAADA